MALIEIILLIRLHQILGWISKSHPHGNSRAGKFKTSVLKKSHIRLWQSEQVMPKCLPVLIYFEGMFPIFCEGRKGYCPLDMKKENRLQHEPHKQA